MRRPYGENHDIVVSHVPDFDGKQYGGKTIKVIDELRKMRSIVPPSNREI